MLFAARQLRRLSLSPTTSWRAELGCLVNLRQLELHRMRYPGCNFYLPDTITQLRQLADFSSCCSENSHGEEKLRLRGLWRLQQLPALRSVAVCDAVMADLTWVEVRRPGASPTGQLLELCPPGCPPCAGCNSWNGPFWISQAHPCVAALLSAALHCTAGPDTNLQPAARQQLLAPSAGGARPRGCAGRGSLPAG
jgi:hypothetical protein